MKHRVLNCMTFGDIPWYSVAKELRVCKKKISVCTLGIMEMTQSASSK